MKKLYFIGSIILMALFFSGCTKNEGVGGSSTIKGKITETKYNSSGVATATYPASDFDVYIIYGSGNTFYNDDVKTSYDGSYQFKYLEKGDYTIFVYEDCLTCPSGKKEILVSTTIENNGDTKDLGTIDVKKY
jgi:hypothetical protein